MSGPSVALVPETLRDRLTALRHALHREPELAFAEHASADRLEAALATLAPASLERVAGTGLLARIRGRRAGGPVIAIRGDIDALPVMEATDAPFRSVRDGIMHACGHDVHAAWTVGAACLLAQDPAVGDVLIVLQPAEETGRGALAILETGALDSVAAIVGAHVDLRFVLGQVVAEAGPLAASTDEFTITVQGRGAHGARPHEGRDPIVAAAAIITALQTIAARRTAPGEPAVVSLGTVVAGSAANIIPEAATLTGTLRAIHPATRQRLLDALEEIAEGVAQAHGTRAIVSRGQGTPPIVNDGAHVAWARNAVTRLLGARALVSLPEPNLGGEDFAFYLERMAGCFLRIGARRPADPITPAHTPRFLPHDDAVPIGAAVLAETAREMSRALAENGGATSSVQRRATPDGF